jgi:hypothetical protein
MRILLCIFAFTLGTIQYAAAQQAPAEKPAVPARAEVLVLGVYHMANPGSDIFNVQVDDVLAPKRQAEMVQLIEVLKRFHPTKIAVETDVSSKRIPHEYADYVAGKRELARNEKEQIGFRLAKELGHKTVYPVDVDGEFPFQRIVNYVKANDRSQEMDSLMGEFGGRVKALDAYLASHTILETLLYLNADDSVAQELGFYYRLARFGEPGEWAGADLIADWFRRNIRIYGNILQLADSPDERVLVIYGSGHLGWLQHSFASNPDLRLRKLVEFAK